MTYTSGLRIAVAAVKRRSVASITSVLLGLLSTHASAQYNQPNPQAHSPNPALQEHVFVGSPNSHTTGGAEVTGPGQNVVKEFTFTIPDNFTIKDIKVQLSLSAYTGSWTDILLFRSGSGSPNVSHRMKLFYFSCNYPKGGDLISKQEAVTFGYRDAAAKNYDIASVPHVANTNDGGDWNDPAVNPYVGFADHKPAEGTYAFAYGVDMDAGEACQMQNPSEVEGSWLSIPEGTYGIDKQWPADVGRWNNLIDSTAQKDGENTWTLRVVWYHTKPLANDPNQTPWTFTASTPLLYLYSDDRVDPEVDIDMPPFAQADVPFDVPITFDQPVDDFTQEDIVVSGGKITAFSGSGKDYQITIEPGINGDNGKVIVTVPDEVAFSIPAGRGNVGNSASTDIDRSARTEAIINNFMARRADIIVSNEPELTDRLLNRGQEVKPLSGSYALTAGNYSANLNMAPVRLGGYDIWSQVAWVKTEDDQADAESFVGYVGIDKRISDHTVLGLLAQVDYFDEVSNTDEYNVASTGWAVDGWGFMVGPYVVTRLYDDVLFDGRVAYGRSYNNITPYLGAEQNYTDEFETERWLVRAQLTGQFEEAGLKVNPIIRWTHYEDKSEAYTDALGGEIAAQEVSLGRITFGPKMSREFVTPNGAIIEPSIGLYGLWDYDKNDYVDLITGLPISGNSDDLRTRVEAGLKMYHNAGTTIDIKGHYDGLGGSNLKSYGGSLKVRVPLP